MTRAVYRATLGVATVALVAAGVVRPALATTEEPVRAFRAIQEVFRGSCSLASCHSAVARKGGLILEHEDLSWAGLVDQESQHPDAKTQGLLRVKSGDPDNSFLMRKLRGQGPGDPMPQGGGMLPDEIIQMVEDWIRRGAHTTAEECPPLVGGEGGQGQHGSGHVPTICDVDPIPGDFEWKPEEALEVPDPAEGVQLYVPPRTVEPGTEWETCYAFKPDFSKLQSTFISRQTYRMHQGSHHLLLYMYFGAHPEQQKLNEFYPCSAANCLNPGDCPEDSDLNQIPIGGTQVAGTRYVVNYPPGVGLPLLSEDAVLIANLHYTNPFQPAQQIYGEAWLNIEFHKPEEFKILLDGIFAINSRDLIVEPYERKEIGRVWNPRSFLTGASVDAAVFQLFGHMHKRGRSFSIEFVDRPCVGDCNEDNECTVNELVTGVNILLEEMPVNRCRTMDVNKDDKVTIDELVSAVNVAVNGCTREPETEIYRTLEWDNAPVEEYDPPYLFVDKDQGLRWSCIHENGRLIDGVEDPTYPSKKCHERCRTCGWEAATRTCKFTRFEPRLDRYTDPLPEGKSGVLCVNNRVDCTGNPDACTAPEQCTQTYRAFAEGAPMPLVFGELADDDMCNMFGYFIHQEDVPAVLQSTL